jgi:Nucleotidyltransferase of unknown function (DUF6036)
VALHCLGGFVVAVRYGLPRPTADLDHLEVIPARHGPLLQKLAGAGSALARTHGLHLQHVTVASLPDRYEERLTPLWPGRFARLALFTLEAHDLALSKLARNSPIDREDVARLARAAPLDPALLRERYQRELRPVIIGDVARHDLTLDLWLEAYFGEVTDDVLD